MKSRFSFLVTAFCLIVAPTLSAYAQDGFSSLYLFEGNANDESIENVVLLTGTESYAARNGSEQALLLQEESYLDFDLDLGQSILTDESFYIAVDFMVPDVGIDESARILFGNKDWSWDAPGFQFQIMNEKTEWQSEGIVYINFNIGGLGNEISGRFYEIPMDEWHTASFFVDFQTEMVTFGYDGRSVTQSLRQDINGGIFDPEPFFQSLSEHSIRIGAPKAPGDGGPIVWELFGSSTTDNIADLQIDNLRISSPRVAGSSLAVSEALNQFSEFLAGNIFLDDSAADVLHAQMRSNLPGVPLAEIVLSVRDFVAAHNAAIGSLYEPEEWAMRDFNDFPAVSRAYVDLGLWMMREGLSRGEASLAEDIVFAEYAQFPGSVPAGAERVTGDAVEILAHYVKDPYYNMGDMQVNEANELSSYVYRPTGFYAAAGEVVRITVDPALVNTGLHIRVGAHKYDHSVFRQTNRFPLIKVDYRIEKASFDVVNPFGGGIYVLVPQNTDLGWVEIGIDGAVRSPYFSLRQSRETTPGEWESIRNYPAPLADFESDSYMFTVPSDAIRSFDMPATLLTKWNQALDVFQVLHGRPAERVRSEAFMFDTRTSVEGSYPGGYPVTPGLWSQGPADITDGAFSPFALLNPGVWESNEGLYAMTHEMAHHHFGYALPYERETFVNVPFAAILNTVFGRDLDYSLKYSTYQRFTREDAAIDWMVTTNFRNGDAIGIDPTTEFQPEEVAYQSRGSAKYLDLADIFGGWEALGAINQSLYDEDKATGIPVSYTSQPEVTRDHFLANGSTVLECNLASLFHFWGIHPSESLAGQLALLPPCPGAIDRVKQYLNAAPRTNEDLRQFHAEKTQDDPFQLKQQIYDPLLLSFDNATGQQIRTIGAQILKQYFDEEADEAPSKPVLLNTEFTLSGNPLDIVSFSWTPSVDPEGQALDYSWRLYDVETGETLVFRSRVSGTAVDVGLDELTQALSPYNLSAEWVTLAQEVTTSDLFTVVSSDPLISHFRDGVGTSNESEEEPSEFRLSEAYPNPFNPVTTISYSLPVTLPVYITVLDVLGREVSVLVDGEIQTAGSHRIQFNAGHLSSGMYLIHMRSGRFSQSKSVLLLK